VNLFDKKILSKTDLESLAAAISDAEKTTSGEIRVVVRHHRHWKERKLSLHDLALNEFRRIGMEQTRDRTGVLILLLVSERQFQIIADEGIHTKVAEGTWDRIALSMSSHFREGKFAQGLTEAVRSVGAELAAHFPRKSDDTNELPNDIIQR
jgi:uncharacterized membrane protein